MPISRMLAVVVLKVFIVSLSILPNPQMMEATMAQAMKRPKKVLGLSKFIF